MAEVVPVSVAGALVAPVLAAPRLAQNHSSPSAEIALEHSAGAARREEGRS